MMRLHSLLRMATVLFLLMISAKTQAQDTNRVLSLGPEFFVGSAYPERSNLQPITTYEVGARAYYPFSSNIALRLNASFRHLDIQWAATNYDYEFGGSYFFLGPAIEYKWFELGLDIGTPLTGNFRTYGSQLADTSSSLAASDMSMLVQIAADVLFPVAQNDGNELLAMISGSYQVSSLVTQKLFILHPPGSREPVTTAGGTLGPIGTIQVGLSWQFNLVGRIGEEDRYPR